MTNAYDFPAGGNPGLIDSATFPAAMSSVAHEPMMAARRGTGGFTIADLPGHKNIAELLPEDRLTTIATDTWDEYDIDKKSRVHKEEIWKRTAEAFNLKSEAKNTPFQNAANVKYPILLQACLQFAARAMPAILHDGKVAKGKVIGKDYETPQSPPGAPAPPGVEAPGLPPLGPGAPPMMPDMSGVAPPAAGVAPLPAQGGAPTPPKPSKRDQADRIAGYLNYQLLDKDTAWVTEMDQAMHQLPAFGTVIKKVYRDPVFGNRSELVSARDFVVNAAYPSLERAPRCTQRFDLYPNEIEERKRDGRFLEVELINVPQPATDEDKKKAEFATSTEDKSAPHEFLEQHRLIDLDEDGYAEPYCVTLHVPSKKVVRITASYGHKDIVLKDQPNPDGTKTVARIKPYRYFVKYGFIPDPDGGFYDIGFGELLMHPTEVINSILNQLIDSGHLSTAGGGFIGKEFRLKSGELGVKPGKFIQTTFAGDDIRKAIIPLEFPQPSPVLFQLLGFLVEQAEKIVSSPEVLTGEAPPNQPATTTLALIEQGLKVFTGIIGRVLRALGHELKVLYDLNARHIDADQVEYFNYGDDQQYVMGADFDPQAADVVPIADASQSTDMQKMAKAEMVINALSHPVIGVLINPVEAANRYFEAAGISPTGLVAEAMPEPPKDPKVELQEKEFEELKKPLGELDAGLKQIQLLQAIMALPPEIQQLMGIPNPVQMKPSPQEEQDMAHKDESHGMDMAGKMQKMDHAEQGMGLKVQQAMAPQ